MDGKQDGGLGQQRKRQPLQEKYVTVIRYEDLKQQCSKHEGCRHEMAVDAADEFRDFPHGSNVCGNIERIGNQQQQDNELKHDRGERTS